MFYDYVRARIRNNSNRGIRKFHACTYLTIYIHRYYTRTFNAAANMPARQIRFRYTAILQYQLQMIINTN